MGELRAAPGDLDSTFGSGGKVAFSIQGSNDNDYGQKLAIQDDGKIVSVGYSYLGQHFALARHNADGSLDTMFGNSGTVYSGFGGAQERGHAVAVQADGKIVAVGDFSPSYPSYLFLIARFNTDGTLDTSFNGTGFDTVDFGAYDSAYAVLVQPTDQKIVVAGQASNANDDFALVRYDTDGSLDTDFGSSGSVETDFGGNSDIAYGLEILPDGKILAVGRSQDGGVNYTAVARYNADGSLDTTFDTDGKVTTLVGEESWGYGVHALDMGKVLVTGWADDGEDSVFALVRYNADGSLDTTFNSTGKVLGPVGNGEASALQEDGKILVAGSFYGANNSDFAVVRFLPDGSVDTGFGVAGRALADFSGTSGNDNGHGVAIQPDGKIVVSGETYDGSQSDFGLARFENPDDPTEPPTVEPPPTKFDIIIIKKKIKKLKDKLKRIKNKASRSKVKKLKKKLKKLKKQLKAAS